LRIKILKTLNELEAFSYNTNDVISEASFVEASSTEERDSLKKQAETNLEWLEEDGSSAGYDELSKRLLEMTRLVDRVKYRIKENKEIPASIKSCRSLVNLTYLLLENITEKYEVTELELNNTLDECKRLEEFLDERENERKDAPPHQDPIFPSTTIDSRCNYLNSLARRLWSKKKIIPKKVEIKPNTTTTEEKTTGDDKTEEESKKEETGETKKEEKKEEKKEDKKEEKTEEDDAAARREKRRRRREGEPKEEKIPELPEIGQDVHN